MFDLIQLDRDTTFSILDVGCGYGGFFQYLSNQEISHEYTGIDVVRSMISWANENHQNGHFICSDFMNYDFDYEFDYVVCNGILTQKLDVEGIFMDKYASNLIKRMFSLCKTGISFNIMSTKVNFFSNNLYYRNPAEIISWCLSEITPHLKLDHSYPLYEYTVCLYKNPI